MPDDTPRDVEETLRDAALAYHRAAPHGKLAVVATKPLASQRDLALAYSPGVAAACDAIVADPLEAAQLTARANLVGVVTNGTAVLGLGDIGPLAGKPVMEGKAVLFKKFAGIDVFDLEVDARDPAHFVEVVAALENTFGGINLEDIKGPDCFDIEGALRERMDIPVFHDDQHGTAIIVAAAVHNALVLAGKEIGEVRLVASGAGAAGISCLDQLVALGLPIGNVIVTDKDGVLHSGRADALHPRQARYVKDTPARRLDEVIEGADIFLGVSAGGVLKPAMVERMADRPIILALANPTPEIMPDLARAARPDAIIATGRSDFPNQVNNVLCFPFIFRGALDVGATTINEEMKLAVVHALAALAREEVPETVLRAYDGEAMIFGPDYVIPTPFDPRLISTIAPAVARAAMDTGVAARPIHDLEGYAIRLESFVFKSGMLMKPVFAAARGAGQRIAYAEGEDERVLHAAQVVVDEGLAKPILVGRRAVVEARIARNGLRLALDEDVELVDPEGDRRFKTYWTAYHEIMARAGGSPDEAKLTVRTNNTVIAALMVRLGDADAMLCGTEGRFAHHLRHVIAVIGLRPEVTSASALSALVLQKGTYFLCDTHVNERPNAEQIRDMVLTAADRVRGFGITPKVALLSHSSFGSIDSEAADRQRAALALIRAAAPELEIDGEMAPGPALDEDIRRHILPDTTLTGSANLMALPNLEAANIAFNLARRLGDGIAVGPILMGVDAPCHVLSPEVTARGILNMTAIAATDAMTRAAALSVP